MSATAVRPRATHAPRLELSFLIERDGRQYHAYSPALKGLHIDGKTIDEALLRAVRAATLYLEALARRWQPLPVADQVVRVPRHAVLRKVTIEWPTNRMSKNS